LFFELRIPFLLANAEKDLKEDEKKQQPHQGSGNGPGKENERASRGDEERLADGPFQDRT
jgi:hypothetical protein